MTSNKDDDIIEIQSRLAFQEDIIDDLNKIVTEQQNQIEKLWTANRILRQQLEKMHFEMGGGEEEAPPPHY